MLVDYVLVAQDVTRGDDGFINVKGLGHPTAEVTALPITLPTMTAHAIFGFEDGENVDETHPAQLLIIDPKGAVLFSVEMGVIRAFSGFVNPYTLNIQGVPASLEGCYRVRIRAGNSVAETTYFEVVLQPTGGELV